MPMSMPPTTESREIVDAGVRGVPRGRVQLGRLFRLVLILQAERFPNARELAERCEISRRTVHRDLELLTEAGIPVRYRPDRQGYQLAKGFFLPPTSLDESEALALVVLARQCHWTDGLGLLRYAWGGAIKLVQTLPAEVRERLLTVAEPFRADTSGDGSCATRRLVQDTIVASLTQLRQARIWYRTVEDHREQCTKFSVYRLILHDRHWFMVGRSSIQRRVEVIGVPWVDKVVLTGDAYTIPPRFNLERFLGQAWGVDRDPIRHRVWLRFSKQVAPELRDTVYHRSQRRVMLADGRLDLHFLVDGIEEILRWILGFGDQVIVLEPSELRRRVFQVATSLARVHRPERATSLRAESRRPVGS